MATEGREPGARRGRDLPPACRRVAARLPALPDRDLKPEELSEVEAHLERCPACRAEAQALAALGSLLREEPVSRPVLPSGAQAVHRILEAEAARAPVERGGWPAWLTGASGPGPFFLRAAAPALLLVALLAGAVTVSVPRAPVPGGPSQEQVGVPGADPAGTLPALVVEDDEWSGRQVYLAPAGPDAGAGTIQ